MNLTKEQQAVLQQHNFELATRQIQVIRPKNVSEINCRLLEEEIVNECEFNTAIARVINRENFYLNAEAEKHRESYEQGDWNQGLARGFE
jgi:hypothetical protein